MEKMMGQVIEEITLVNDRDVGLVNAGVRSDVRQVTVEAIVDTGASTLVINEDTRQRLGVEVIENKRVHLANGGTAECGVTEPVYIHWKSRQTACPAVVIPDAKQTLLGAIPLEGMDLMVDPVRQHLVGAHGDEMELLAL
jgi:clan AA aspartic protease